MERHRRDRQGARRLDDEPAPLGGQPDGGGDLGLRDGHDRIEVGAQVRERPRPERLGPRPVGDRPRHELGRPADDLAALERVARVGGQLGFDADDPDARPERLDRGRDPAGQPAATDRHEDDGEVRQVLERSRARPSPGRR